MASESRRSPRARASVEGPEAVERFEKLLGRVITVSKEELNRREAEYQKNRPEQKRRVPSPKV
jgi:hypothetical protein